MQGDDVKRISRLTAILIQLQTKGRLTATSLSEKFGVSKRTIYRDLKTLERAGVPILTEKEKGYTLVDGYNIPPVMFTEKQANALILAEQLVLKNKDASFVKDYSEAIDKIKSILKYKIKDKANLLVMLIELSITKSKIKKGIVVVCRICKMHLPIISLSR